jgi:hypothetical protein
MVRRYRRRFFGHRGVSGVRRQHRHGDTAGGHRLVLGTLDIFRRHNGLRGDTGKHAVACRARHGRRAIRPARFGRLRQGDQKRDFRNT